LDPICLLAIALFVVNRWWLKPAGVAPTFTHGYVNDLLCLPIFVPLSLLMQRWVRLRRHDRPPLAWEIVQHWIVFSVTFELIVPRLPGFRSTADAWDVVAYLVGAAVAWIGWHWRSHAAVAGRLVAAGRCLAEVRSRIDGPCLAPITRPIAVADTSAARPRTPR
jgi:hypothetical protein